MQSDIDHMRDRQAREHYRFPIHPVGGRIPKLQRIERLVPLFQAGRIWFPNRTMFVATDTEVHDFTAEFHTDEYLSCPVLPHDDMLDCLARILDVPAAFPSPITASARSRAEPNRTNNTYNPLNPHR
jgi:hypothetical protein